MVRMAKPNLEALELMRRTHEVEEEKELKTAERELRKAEKAHKNRQAFLERLVAPILLGITMVVSLFLALRQ